MHVGARHRLPNRTIACAVTQYLKTCFNFNLEYTGSTVDGRLSVKLHAVFPFLQNVCDSKCKQSKLLFIYLTIVTLRNDRC